MQTGAEAEELCPATSTEAEVMRTPAERSACVMRAGNDVFGSGRMSLRRG